MTTRQIQTAAYAIIKSHYGSERSLRNLRRVRQLQNIEIATNAAQKYLGSGALSVHVAQLTDKVISLARLV